MTPAEPRSPAALLHRLVELFNERDWERFRAAMHPDFEFDSVIMAKVRGAASEQRSYRGWEGLREWLEDVIDAFEDFRFDSLEVTPIGSGAVFEVSRLAGRGRGSGIDVTYEFARLVEFEDGLVRRIRTFADIDDGRRAAAELRGDDDAPGEVPRT